MGTDVGKTAIAAVEGAIEAAGSLGKDTTEFAQAAVIGVIHAADKVGTESGAVVRKALLSAASLPHDVIEAAIKG